MMDAGAPIKNPGYFDVPICNEYSNKEIREIPIKTNNYLLNRQLNLTLNNNKGNYIVYQDPVVPSPSLYLETDAPMSGYYYKNPMNLAFDGTVPIPNKKDSKVYNYINSDLYPPFGIESFKNEDFNKHKSQFFCLIILLIIIYFYFLSK
jgi:hypothetical protein